MKNLMKPISPYLSAAALILALSLVSATSIAHEYVLGDIELVHPYAPPTPPGVAMAAGYVEIVNHGKQDDRLMGGKVDFAHEVQIHQTIVENDVSRMRELEGGLVIPAGSSVKIEPMGIHRMFADLADPLIEGDRQSVTLYFEKAGEIEVEFAIEHPIGDAMHGEQEGGMKMDGMEMEGMKH